MRETGGERDNAKQEEEAHEGNGVRGFVQPSIISRIVAIFPLLSLLSLIPLLPSLLQRLSCWHECGGAQTLSGMLVEGVSSRGCALAPERLPERDERHPRRRDGSREDRRLHRVPRVALGGRHERSVPRSCTALDVGELAERAQKVLLVQQALLV